MSLNKEPNNTFEAQQFALALQEYIEAAQAEAKARSEYEGYSWDYYGSNYIDRRDSSAGAMAEKLNVLIDSRVASILKPSSP